MAKNAPKIILAINPNNHSVRDLLDLFDIACLEEQIGEAESLVRFIKKKLDSDLQKARVGILDGEEDTEDSLYDELNWRGDGDHPHRPPHRLPAHELHDDVEQSIHNEGREEDDDDD